MTIEIYRLHIFVFSTSLSIAPKLATGSMNTRKSETGIEIVIANVMMRATIRKITRRKNITIANTKMNARTVNEREKI